MKNGIMIHLNVSAKSIASGKKILVGTFVHVFAKIAGI